MNKKLIIILFVFGLFFAQNSRAAVEDISYVRQDCTGYSSCYTSLSAWEEAYGGINFTGCTVGDLTCVDKIATVQIDGAWTLADTTPVVIDGWTTDATRYIKIYTTSTARHTGKWDDTKYRIVLPVDTNEAVLNINENYTRVFGLQIDNSIQTTEYSGGSGIKINSATSYIGYNIIRKISPSATGTYGIYDYYGADYNLYAYNNIIYGNFSNGINIWDYKSSPGSGSAYIENNTIDSGIYSGWSATNGKKIKVTNNNILSRTYLGKTVTFIDEANGDFHLGASDTTAIDQGNTNPSSRFTDDIDGVTRTGYWDIGADESVVVDTTPPVLLSRYPTGILPVGTTSTALILMTDVVSTCKYSTTPGTSYSSMTNTFITGGTDPTRHVISVFGLTNGSNYTYYVRCKDSPGNANTSDYLVSFSVATPFTIIPDTTPPTVYLSSPSAGTTIAGTYITISAGATDNIGVSEIQFFVDGVSKGTDTTFPYSISWDITNSGQHLCVNAHTHTLTAKATDTAGNATVSSGVIVNMNRPSYCPATSTKFLINDRVNANGILNVRDTPAGTSLGVQFTGTQGTVIGGPIRAYLFNNYWWWNVDYDTGADGWTAEYLLNGGPVSSYTTVPPTISLVVPSSITINGANITWTTSELSDTQVEYGSTEYGTIPAYGSLTTLNPSMVTSHSVSLMGLSANTLYHYRVKSKDAVGNLAVSGDFTFTTKITDSTFADTTAPVISAVAVSSITSTGVIITWTTNELSDSQIEYGLSAAYGSSTTLNTLLTTSHSQTLSGLTPGALYHYSVKSRDSAGNLAVSLLTLRDFTFSYSGAADTTLPVISTVVPSSITSTGVTITWTTDESSDSQIEYGTTILNGVPIYTITTTLNPAMVTSHSVSLTGLSANTLYHYRVKSKDSAGNLAVSRDFTFITKPISLVCGNSIIETGEQCDQGMSNGVCPATCSLSCVINSCPVIVDTISPTISIIAPVTGNIVAGTINISAAAFDNVGIAGIQFKLDGINLGLENTTNYSISWNTASTTNADHTLTAVARDMAGNTATSSVVTITVNNNVTPVIPSTPIGNLQAQINALMAQIATLQSQQAISSGSTPIACVGVTFIRNLAVGSTGSDVKCLQALLNTSPLTQVATFGAGSPGNESIYFGPRTLVSVATYQAQQGWTPAGQVGPFTRVKLNEWLNILIR